MDTTAALPRPPSILDENFESQARRFVGRVPERVGTKHDRRAIPRPTPIAGAFPTSATTGLGGCSYKLDEAIATAKKLASGEATISDADFDAHLETAVATIRDASVNKVEED